MEQEKKWIRPQDIEIRRTSDPKEMLGKYLPNRVLRTWTEEFTDSDTGEKVTIERNEIVCEAGLITQSVLQEITFALQSGDIKDVEICDKPFSPYHISPLIRQIPFNVVLYRSTETKVYVVHAQTIPQAIQIAADFGNVYRDIIGDIFATKVTPVNAEILPDDDSCIPEDERLPEEEEKPYFSVTWTTKWVERGKLKKSQKTVIVNAKDVEQANERILRKIEQLKTEGYFKTEEGFDMEIIVSKAVMFNVDCMVPQSFSKLYLEKPE